MPQLNPTPWFTIMITSWAILLIIMPTKIMAHNFPNAITTQSTEKPKTEPWNWPWH
uniref:ATP synthase complex subunit 8 n=2 Tax=Gadopsis TaxID=135753 RepID=A0A068W6H6_9TELE|nr:ATP synthase F0 subunit 8 [Gadopsis marmoratus]YP_009058376.1 ATP synthase F0 subunit 8 [Gadopsis bispinosus]WJQ22132.1 ATP synthase F0 subunit 8 [Gadopsis bispinosus]WJQ22158.1 ATP synthase F0 subunit 8 [Gadopsis marmoratus]WJQ22171.1 ATP synthase F0 subunit 8 [Gadopsis marmoratus]CDR98387.1 ATP synthase F0 subunit 8 [Gadopsis marmoratus]BAP40379.1 ATPase subunit 8 [Gadopsis bispinosus]